MTEPIINLPEHVMKGVVISGPDCALLVTKIDSVVAELSRHYDDMPPNVKLDCVRLARTLAQLRNRFSPPP